VPTLEEAKAALLSPSTSSSEKSLYQVSKEKLTDVANASDTIRQQVDALKAFRDHQNNTFTGKLGLDRNSLAAGVINTPIAAVNDVSKIWAKTGAHVADGYSAYQMNENEDLAKYNKGQEIANELRKFSFDSALPIDDNNEIPQSFVRRSTDYGVSFADGSVSALEGVVGLGNMVSGGYVGKWAEENGVDPKQAHTMFNEMYSNNQNRVFKSVDEAKGFINTAMTMLVNPSSISHGITKSLPSIVLGGAYGKALGAAGLVKSTALAGAIGEGATMAGSAAEGIRQETEDGLLSLKQLAAAGSTGVVGTAISRLGAKVTTKAGLGDDLDTAVVSGSLGKSTHGLVGNVLGKGVIEGGEELLQTGEETIFKNLALERDATEGLGKAMAEGMLTGAGMGALSGAGTARAKETPKPNEARMSIEERAVFNESSKTGDVSILLDDQTEYRPDLAIQALMGHSNREGATAEEVASNLAKVQEIQKEQAARSEEVKTRTGIVNDETLQVKQEFLEKAKEVLATKTTPESIASVQAKIDAVEAEIVSYKNLSPQEKADNLKQQSAASIMSKEVDELSGHMAKLFGDSTKTQQSEEEITTALSEITPALAPVADATNTTEVEAATAAGRKAMTLAMHSPESVDSATLTQLADNESNGLSLQERAYVRKLATSHSKMMEAKALEDGIIDQQANREKKASIQVRNDIIHGNPAEGHIGGKEYAAGIRASVAAGDGKKANALMGSLSTFAAGHQEKLTAIVEGLALLTGDNDSRTVIYGKDKTLKITKASFALRNRVQAESKYLNSVQAAMQELMDAPDTASVAPTTSKPIKKTKAAKVVPIAPKVVKAKTATPALIEQPAPKPVKVKVDSGGGAQAGASIVDIFSGSSEGSRKAHKVIGVKKTVAPNGNTYQHSEVRIGADFTEAGSFVSNILTAAKDMIAVGESFKEGDTLFSGSFSRVVESFRDAKILDYISDYYAKDNKSYYAGKIKEEFDRLNSKQEVPKAVGSAKQKKAGPAKPKGARKKPNRDLDSLLDYVVRLGGIRVADRLDITGDTTANHKLPFVSSLFNKTGRAQSPDGLLRMLEDDGYIPNHVIQSGDQLSWLKEAIKGQLNGDTTIYASESAAENQQNLEAEAQRIQDQIDQAKDEADAALAAEIEAKQAIAADLAEQVSELEDQVDALDDSYLDSTNDALNDANYGTDYDYENNTGTAEGIVEESGSADQQSEGAQETDVESFESGYEAETTAEVAPYVPETGTLDGLGERTKEQAKEDARTIKDTAWYRSTNMLHFFFKQRSPKKDTNETTNRNPLVEVKDFFTNWVAGNVKVESFLESGEVKEGQSLALALFKELGTAMFAALDSAIVPKRDKGKTDEFSEFRYNDYFQYFMDLEGNVEENVKTVIAASVFSYIGGATSGNARKSRSRINRMLGFHEDAYLPADVYTELEYAVDTEAYAALIMGKEVFKALGLIERSPGDTNLDVQAKMEMALGFAALGMLYNLQDTAAGSETSLATEQVFKKSDYLSQAYSSEEGINLFAETKLIRFTPGAENITRIQDAYKGSQDVVGQLFGLERTKPPAATKPAKAGQERINNTDRTVSSTQAELVATQNEKPEFVDVARVDLLQRLDVGVREAIFGIKDVTTENTHAALLPGLEGKYGSMREDWEGVLNFVNNMADKFAPIYLTRDVWRNFRVGILHTDMNPQTSKIVRFVLRMQSWEQTYDLNNEAEVNMLKLRIIEGFGYKTDASLNKDNLKYFDTFVNQPTIVKGIAAMNMLNGAFEDSTMEHQNDLQNAIELGENNLHTYDALAALAALQLAPLNEESTVTVSLMGEVDGKTNGVILSQAMAGVFGNEALERGGIYGMYDNAAKSFAEWKAGGVNQDTYEKVASVLREFINQSLIKDPSKKGMARALFSILSGKEADSLSDSVGRKFVKTPVTGLNYSAGTATAVSDLGGQFIEKYYELVSKAGPNSNPKLKLPQLIEMINTFLPVKSSLPVDISHADAMKHVFNRYEEKGIQENFSDLVKKPVREALDKVLGETVEKKRRLNSAANVAFFAYKAAFDLEVTKYTRTMINLGTLPVAKNEAKTPLMSLTKNQLDRIRARLKHMEPAVHTWFSQNDGTYDSAVFLAAKGTVPSTKAAFLTDTKVAINGKKKTLRAYASEFTLLPPGVSTDANLTQSTDSAISLVAAAKENDVLNAHDAHFGAAKFLDSIATNLNQATFKVLSEYSPYTQMANTTGRVLAGFAEYLKKNSVQEEGDPRTAEEFAEDLKALKASFSKAMLTSITTLHPFVYKLTKKHLKGHLVSTVHNIVVAGKQSDVAKFKGFSDVAVIDQYSNENGTYTLTEEDRAEMAAKAEERAKVPVDPALVDAMKVLEEFSVPIEPGVQKALYADEALLDTVLEALTKGMPLAEVNAFVKGVGNPKVEQAPVEVSPQPVPVSSGKHADLVNYFIQNANGNTVGSLLAFMDEHMKAVGTKGTGYRTLLRMVKKAVDPNVSIVWVTKDNEKEATYNHTPGMEHDRSLETANGWVSTDAEGNTTIFIRGTNKGHTNVTSEMVVHELLHLALQSAIAEGQFAAKGSAANTAYKDLEALRLALVAKDTEGKFSHMLTDVHELVSYGMTNSKFQTFMMGVEYKSTIGQTIKETLKSFASKLISLLTNKPATAAETNALAVLNLHVVQMFDEVASQPKGTAFAASHPHVGAAAMLSMTTEDIFNGLADAGKTHSAEHLDRLSNALRNIGDALVGPLGVDKGALAEYYATDARDLFTQAMNSGVAPFASDLQTGPITLSDQELFVAEQVHAATLTSLEAGNAYLVNRNIGDLFMEMRQSLKDTMPADKWEGVFGDPSIEGQAKFVALGVASEEFAALLQVPTKKRSAIHGDNYLEKLISVMEAVLNFAMQKLDRVHSGQLAGVKLNKLARQLVGIEAKNRFAVKSKVASVYATAGDTSTKIEKGIRQQIDNIGKAQIFRKGNNYAKAVGVTLSMSAQHRVPEIFQQMMVFRDKLVQEKHGILAGIANEMLASGPSKAIQENLFLLTKGIERARRTMFDNTKNILTQEFANKGKELTKPVTEAMTKVFMRTDLQVLTKDSAYSLQDIRNLMDSAANIEAAIKAEQAKMVGSQVQDIVNDAQDTAIYMVTNGATHKNVAKNAHNVARRFGYSSKIMNAAAAHAEVNTPIVDRIISLYALRFSAPADAVLVKGVMDSEANRSVGNGVQFLLGMHSLMVKQSLEDAFEGDPSQMVKGFTASVVNPHRELYVGTFGEAEEMKRLGFKMETKLEKALEDSDTEQRVLYYRRYGGLSPRVSGSISYSAKKSAGSRKEGAIYDPVTGTVNRVNLARVRRATKAIAGDINALNGRGPNYDASRVETKATNRIPIFAHDGTVSGYRYEMLHDREAKLLERNLDFTVLMAALSASLVDKKESPQNNKTIVEALYAQYLADFASNPKAYVEISENSKDPEHRELYAMLPPELKKHQQAVWGDTPMMVSYDSLDIVFGYRKLSITGAFEKEETARTAAEKIVVKALEKMMPEITKMVTPFRDKNGDMPATVTQLRYAEAAWQGVVSEAKDFLVIKSVGTLVGNIQSNISLLLVSGVNPAQLVKSHIVALRGVLNYRRDSTELHKLEAMVSSGYPLPNSADVQVRIKYLTGMLESNPVKKLIDAGMLPTIVEDVDPENDLYSLKAGLSNYLEGKIGGNKVGQAAVTVAKTLYMAHDTPLYQLLSHTTQLSDFVGRYTLYQHLTTRDEKRMTHTEALDRAMKSFVNYDLPSHRAIQYGNDMGILMFTKYYMRIQQVLFTLFKEEPAKVLTVMAFGQLTGGVSVLTDSGITNNIGNPLKSGALMFPSVLDESIVAQTIGAAIP
jgi:hypothetical protein